MGEKMNEVDSVPQAEKPSYASKIKFSHKASVGFRGRIAEGSKSDGAYNASFQEVTGSAANIDDQAKVSFPIESEYFPLKAAIVVKSDLFYKVDTKKNNSVIFYPQLTVPLSWKLTDGIRMGFIPGVGGRIIHRDLPSYYAPMVKGWDALGALEFSGQDWNVTSGFIYSGGQKSYGWGYKDNQGYKLYVKGSGSFSLRGTKVGYDWFAQYRQSRDPASTILTQKVTGRYGQVEYADTETAHTDNDLSGSIGFKFPVSQIKLGFNLGFVYGSWPKSGKEHEYFPTGFFSLETGDFAFKVGYDRNRWGANSIKGPILSATSDFSYAFFHDQDWKLTIGVSADFTMFPEHGPNAFSFIPVFSVINGN